MIKRTIFYIYINVYIYIHIFAQSIWSSALLLNEELIQDGWY